MIDSPSPSSLGDSQHAVALPSILIIQPGSKYLRIGRASDLEPLTILHAIARKRKQPVLNGTSPGPNSSMSDNFHRDRLISLLPGNSIEEKLPPEVESARLQLCHTLQTSLRPDGSQRYITPNEQISAFNRISKVEVMGGSEKPPGSDHSDDAETQQKETIVGDDVVTGGIAANSEYNVHFPWRRGRFNLHSGIGGSQASVLNDLGDIWEWAISQKLGIPLKNRLTTYRVIVIIPVMFDRAQAKELMDLAINHLQFGYALVVQDHVCAALGSALSSATVVDVGDQRISISCVEEGRSVPETRIELKYGGGDLTLALWNLMGQSNVPFKLDLSSLWDLQFLNKLKEDLCHFDLSRCGPEEHSVVWDKPGESTVRYNILFGDELLIVPLSYFNPDLLRGSVETTNSISVWKAGNLEIYDDPCDAAFISEYAHIARNEDEDDGEGEFLEDVKDVPLVVTTEATKKIDLDQLLGIDQAILHSIDSCGGEELKRRFYSCILVVGGGFKFQGLGSWLQNKIALNVPRAYRSDTVEVVTVPKDPSIAAWRGGAFISNLQTTAEVWISEAEWNTHGSRILRERSLTVF